MSKGRDCRRNRAVGAMGFNQVIIFLFKILTNVGTMDNHLTVWETWGLGIFISEMGKGE